LSDADAARFVEQFQAAGLLQAGPDGRVRYAAQSESLAAHVAMLSQAYRERPVTLFRVIYALRDLKIRSFAHAIKARRK
jgi:hypothetical protein